MEQIRPNITADLLSQTTKLAINKKRQMETENQMKWVIDMCKAMAEEGKNEFRSLVSIHHDVQAELKKRGFSTSQNTVSWT